MAFAPPREIRSLFATLSHAPTPPARYLHHSGPPWASPGPPVGRQSAPLEGAPRGLPGPAKPTPCFYDQRAFRKGYGGESGMTYAFYCS